MLALCWHNMPAHYAFYYAGIFDGDLSASLAPLYGLCIPNLPTTFTTFLNTQMPSHKISILINTGLHIAN